jgi:CheY-like chemotaxis protein
VPVAELGDVFRIHPLLEAIGGEPRGIRAWPMEDGVQLLIPTAGQRVILLVEDNPGVVQLLRRYLGYHGYRVVSMASSAECLQLLDEQRPAAIVLDIMLPCQDGWEILRELRAHPSGKDVPILVCSVLDEAPIAQSLGANAYLRKPFSQSEILALLSTLMAGR